MKYGYVRVSTAGQNVARQVRKMQKLGIPEENVFIDKASGKDMERDEWQRLMSVITNGDYIVIDSLDRLGRDYDLVTVEWRRITREVGCDIKVLEEGLEFFDSTLFREMGDIGKCIEDMLLSLLAYVAQTERQKNRQRQADGIAIAKEQGKYKGGTPKQFDPALLESVTALLGQGGKKTEAAKMLGVTRGTIYNMLKQGRLCA